jgi:peptidoglycan hydrolase-like protein with peptidoglycan-binding domain
MSDVRLQRGDQGEWVEYLQQVFHGKGISHGAVDGVFGEVLETTVKTYQEDNGLTIDGVVDSQTWACLTPEEPASEYQAVTPFDWSQFPFLSELAQYPGTEDGIRQFLIARGIDLTLLESEA